LRLGILLRPQVSERNAPARRRPAKGPGNRIEPVSKAQAGHSLLTNILFFAEDAELVSLVFQSACEFVTHVPVYRLTFAPDARVWEMIS
jgi:hypothetical protein